METSVLEKVGRLIGRHPRGGDSREKETIDLSSEWNRQARILAKLFAKELKFKTQEEYIATLPKFEPQPESFKGRLDTLLLVETRVPIERQCKLAGIDYAPPHRYGIDQLSSVEDWTGDSEGYKTPNTPYATWTNTPENLNPYDFSRETNEGKRFLNRDVKGVRQELLADERGGTVFDGVALYIAKPQYVKDLTGRGFFLELLGTSIDVQDNRFPVMGMSLLEKIGRVGMAELSSYGHDPGFYALVCGRQK